MHSKLLKKTIKTSPIILAYPQHRATNMLKVHSTNNHLSSEKRRCQKTILAQVPLVKHLINSQTFFLCCCLMSFYPRTYYRNFLWWSFWSLSRNMKERMFALISILWFYPFIIAVWRKWNQKKKNSKTKSLH